MILGENNKKPEIEYPVRWTYKIIGENIDKMIEAVESIIDYKEFEIVPSNVSKNNKYFSISLVITLDSEYERQNIFDTLQNSEYIKIVL